MELNDQHVHTFMFQHFMKINFVHLIISLLKALIKTLVMVFQEFQINLNFMYCIFQIKFIRITFIIIQLEDFQ